ncbi:MAG: hypothetical protein AAF726_03205 [Planctomycetota bacterium]
MADTRRRITWPRSIAIAAAGLWIPSLVGLATNYQLRREWQDVWFWPGAVVGKDAFDDLYTPQHAWFALAGLVIWSVLARRWWFVGAPCALAQGVLSILYLTALFAM